MKLIGVDLGIHKVSIAVFTEGDEGLTLQQAETFVASKDHAKSVQLAALSSFVAEYAAFHAVDHLFIEDVIVGNNRKYSIALAQTLGAVLSALSVSVLAGLDVRLVDNKVWKKQVIGNGNADKEDIQNYIVEVHPGYAPLCGDDQDLYDATCVGLYGLQLLERAASLRL